MQDSQIRPALLFSVLCDDIRREDNGKFMLLGLFETIGASSFPVRHHILYVMNCWCSGVGTFHQQTRIIAPDNKKMVEDTETEFRLPNIKSKHRVIARFNNIYFENPGEYAVEVLLNGELNVRYPLVVEQINPKKDDNPK